MRDWMIMIVMMGVQWVPQQAMLFKSKVRDSD